MLSTRTPDIVVVYAFYWHRELSVSPHDDFIVYPSQPDLESMFLSLYWWFLFLPNFLGRFKQLLIIRLAQMYNFSDPNPAHIATMKIISAI